MKKGLLTLLAASLVFVGCQNYDDQFDDLNAQISALKSQVDGLASLSGQVSSLSGTISGLQSGIAAAQASAASAATAASAAGASADAATAAATANASAIAAATAAATAAGASADAATAAATAATDAANAAVASGATNAEAIAAATAAATAAGASADAATAAAQAATTAATTAGTTASTNATDLDALSASLTSLAADVAAVQAAIATASTAEAVAALQDEIDAIEADLDNLLTSSNVYATAISITSAADMAAALALGNKVALMNNTVTITDNASIADADIQTFVNRIKTITNTLTYSSGTATGFTPTFDELTSAKAITLTVAGDISFAKLASATDIVIHDDFETKITSVSFPVMTSVSGIDTDEGGSVKTDELNVDSATSIDLGSLTRYGSSLGIRMKKGGTLDIASLDDVNADGDQSDLALTINGPDSLTLTKIEGGALALTNVATASVSGLYSAITINGGVKDLTVTKGVKIDLSSAADLQTATLNLVNSYDADLTTLEKAAAAKGNSATYTADLSTINAPQLTTLTLTGNWLDLTINSGETNLTTLSIDGTFDDLDITAAPDLTTLTISDDSKFGDVTLVNNPNLVVADFDHSFSGAQQATAATFSTVKVTGNSSLEKLHWAADDVGSLTVTGNDKLVELDFTGLADDGGATSPVVYVYDNDLTAVKSTDADDGDTEAASGATGDLGTFDSGTSGMKTLSAYLGHVDGSAKLGAYVSFDTVSTAVNNENDADTTDLNVTYQNATTWNYATVMYKTNEVSTTAPTGGVATTAKRSLLLDLTYVTTLQLYAGGTDILDIDGDGAGARYDATGQSVANVLAALNDADNVARAAANGVTFQAYAGGNSTAIVHIGTERDSALWETSAATVTGINLTASDIITFKVGNATVTTSVVTNQGSAFGKVQAVTDAVQAAWVAKVTAASEILYDFASANVEASSTISNAKGNQLIFTANDIGTDGAGLEISLTAASVDGTTTPILPVAYGVTNATGDNTSIGPDVVVTFTDTVSGPTNNNIGLPATSATSGTFSLATVSWVIASPAGLGSYAEAIPELHTNYKPNAGTGKAVAGLSGDQHSDESWGDVTYPEANNYLENKTISTAAVALKSRLGWL